MRRLFGVMAAAAMLSACQGEKGSDGPQGPQGPGGTSVGTISGVVRDGASAPIANASVVTVPASTAASTAANGSYTIANVPLGVYTVQVSATGYAAQSVSNVSVAAGATATVNVNLSVPAATTGSVQGVVKKHGSASGTALASATVALVDAGVLASSTSEAPLETLAGSSLYSVTTDASGAYTISGVAPGSYFIHVAPPAADTSAFPGGDASRQSFAVAAGATVTKDVTVSQRAPLTATYVGSSACLLCHTNALGGGATKAAGNWKKTLHANVYRAPGVASANQDLSGLPNHDAALAFFEDGNAVGPDNTGAGDELGLRISKTDEAVRWSAFSGSRGTPATPVNYNLLLGKDATGYFVQTETTDKVTKSDKYYVIFTFGGNGIYKERWVTRAKADKSFQPCTGAPATACTDWSYYVLPLQYDENLQSGVQPFHPYNFANWDPPAAAGGPALFAGQGASFDLNCAGCHFTGTTLTRNANGNYMARAASAAGGAIDYDSDGNKDDVSIGCEACHGPGSAHAAAPGLGKDILQPRLLSAERENQMCGNCHTRGVGKGGFTGQTVHTEYPSKGTDTLTFAYPGMGRTEFVTDFHTDGLGTFNDAKKHSRQHHQQANDLIKSKHTKNPFDLVSCSDCHDMHDRQNGPSLAASTADNKLCLDCHAPFGFGLAPGFTKEQEALAVSSHMSGLAYMSVGYNPVNAPADVDGLLQIATGGVGRCTTCHMPKTAASQSRFVHEGVNATTMQPSGARIRGDISSHYFDIIWPATSESVLINFTSNNLVSNSCGSCHNSLVGILPNYAY